MEPGPTLSAFWRRAVIVSGIAVALVLAYLLRGVLVPLFFAFLLAYALDPFVDRLERWKIPRTVGAIVVMIALFGLVALFITFAVPYFAEELRAAAVDLPREIDALRAARRPVLVAHVQDEAAADVGRAPRVPADADDAQRVGVRYAQLRRRSS